MIDFGWNYGKLTSHRGLGFNQFPFWNGTMTLPAAERADTPGWKGTKGERGCGGPFETMACHWCSLIDRYQNILRLFWVSFTMTTVILHCYNAKSQREKKTDFLVLLQNTLVVFFTPPFWQSCQFMLGVSINGPSRLSRLPVILLLFFSVRWGQCHKRGVILNIVC